MSFVVIWEQHFSACGVIVRANGSHTKPQVLLLPRRFVPRFCAAVERITELKPVLCRWHFSSKRCILLPSHVHKRLVCFVPTSFGISTGGSACQMGWGMWLSRARLAYSGWCSSGCSEIFPRSSGPIVLSWLRSQLLLWAR